MKPRWRLYRRCVRSYMSCATGCSLLRLVSQVTLGPLQDAFRAFQQLAVNYLYFSITIAERNSPVVPSVGNKPPKWQLLLKCFGPNHNKKSWSNSELYKMLLCFVCFGGVYAHVSEAKQSSFPNNSFPSLVVTSQLTPNLSTFSTHCIFSLPIFWTHSQALSLKGEVFFLMPGIGWLLWYT